MISNKIEVSATVRIVSTIKNKPLTETENYNCQVSMMPGIDYPDKVKREVILNDVAYQFTEVFQERLKRTPALKNKIGGTKWSVDVSSVQY